MDNIIRCLSKHMDRIYFSCGKIIGSLERNIFLTQKHSLTLILPVLVHVPEHWDGCSTSIADQERLQTVQSEASISACVVITTLLYEMHNSLNPNQSHNCYVHKLLRILDWEVVRYNIHQNRSSFAWRWHVTDEVSHRLD